VVAGNTGVGAGGAGRDMAGAEDIFVQIILLQIDYSGNMYLEHMNGDKKPARKIQRRRVSS
jgi:hypothetical protein